MGSQVGNVRLAGQASEQQRAAASEGIQMRRAALRNTEQGGGVSPSVKNEAPSGNQAGGRLDRIGAQMGDKGSPAYEQAMQRIRGTGPRNNPNSRY